MEFILKLLALLSVSIFGAFGNQESDCRNGSIWISHTEKEDCFVCYNISISSIEEFKRSHLELSEEKCISFDGGNIGPVNSDFFKQFPEAVTISLNNVKMSLKSSQVIEEHTNLEFLYISNCEIGENRDSNAFHSLKKLKTFHLSDCLFKENAINKMLLEKNVNIIDIDLKDSSSSSNLNINENALENIPNLKQISLRINKMKSIPQKLLEEKTKLESIKIHSELDEFPSNLPGSIKKLEIRNSVFKKVTKNNFENLSNLEIMSIEFSDLEEIEENSFESLGKLNRLNLGNNHIKEFSSQYLKNNEMLRVIDIRSNPCADQLDLSDLGFKELISGLCYRS